MHGENDLAVLSNAESELPSQLDTYALQQVAEAVPQRNRPEEPLITPDSEKAVAGSAPGSEYWLP
jgi:hypothetical protein